MDAETQGMEQVSAALKELLVVGVSIPEDAMPAAQRLCAAAGVDRVFLAGLAREPDSKPRPGGEQTTAKDAAAAVARVGRKLARLHSQVANFISRQDNNEVFEMAFSLKSISKRMRQEYNEKPRRDSRPPLPGDGEPILEKKGYHLRFVAGKVSVFEWGFPGTWNEVPLDKLSQVLAEQVGMLDSAQSTRRLRALAGTARLHQEPFSLSLDVSAALASAPVGYDEVPVSAARALMGRAMLHVWRKVEALARDRNGGAPLSVEPRPLPELAGLPLAESKEEREAGAARQARSEGLLVAARLLRSGVTAPQGSVGARLLQVAEELEQMARADSLPPRAASLWRSEDGAFLQVLWESGDARALLDNQTQRILFQRFEQGEWRLPMPSDALPGSEGRWFVEAMGRLARDFDVLLHAHRHDTLALRPKVVRQVGGRQELVVEVDGVPLTFGAPDSPRARTLLCTLIRTPLLLLSLEGQALLPSERSP